LNSAEETHIFYSKLCCFAKTTLTACVATMTTLATRASCADIEATILGRGM
jgi:hypothetical protein